MRTTIVSTSKLKKYKRLIVVLDAIILVAIIGYIAYKYINALGGLTENFLPIIIYLQFHIYFGLFLKLKNVSYDESSIYYNKENYEVQVPFEDIASIEIKTITGIYGIKLFRPSQGNKEILFKTSLWYPLNFQKKDDMVNVLRDKVDRYKRTLPERNFAGLPSYNL